MNVVLKDHVRQATLNYLNAMGGIFKGGRKIKHIKHSEKYIENHWGNQKRTLLIYFYTLV